MANLSVPMAVMELTNGASLVLEAVDPVDGSAIAGVIVSNVAITALDLSDQQGSGDGFTPSPLLVPSEV